jgi:site-specific DNA recombinase
LAARPALEKRARQRYAYLKATRDQACGDADRAFAHIKRIGPANPLESLRRLADVDRCKLRNDDGTFACGTGNKAEKPG